MVTQLLRVAASAAAVLWASAAGSPASADDYFAGRTVTVQVPAGSGGTYHVYCQIVQRHIGKHIPGHPSTVIQNKPGGGGATSAAYMMNAAPKDGTYIAMIGVGTASIPVVRKVKFDAREFNWLGSVAARSSGIWIWHTHGIRTLDDLKKREVTIASTGFSSSGSVVPRLINHLLGTKMKVITGYKSGGDLNVAIERLETMGRWNFRSGFTGVRPTWIPEKQIIPIIATGPRDPELKGVPHLRDMLPEGSVGQKMYDVVGMDLEIGQAFFTAPGVPKNVVAILTRAFDDMIADPAVKAEIIKRGIEFSPLSAAKVTEMVKAGYAAATPEVVRKLIDVNTPKKKS